MTDATAVVTVESDLMTGPLVELKLPRGPGHLETGT